MTEPRDIDHEAIVARSLAMLGAGETPLLGFDVLAGGASGASTYRLRRVAGDAVLKVTQSESPPHLLNGARREVLFYRHLAPTLPIRVPTVIASRLDDGDGVVLLLEAYECSPQPELDGGTWYLRVAEDLARFHATFWRKDQDLASFAWLRRHDLTDDDVRSAHHRWERLRADERFHSRLTADRCKHLFTLLDRIGNDDPPVAAFPRTLFHGDFHIDNILTDRDRAVVVADWQETGPGRGPEDLSFFLQRAGPDRAGPREAMIDTYAQHLSALVDEDIPTRAVRRVMDLSELRTRLIHWPAFISDDGQLADLLDRIDALAADLETGTFD